MIYRYVLAYYHDVLDNVRVSDAKPLAPLLCLLDRWPVTGDR